MIMRKMMIVALMAMASTAFAGNSPALKSILKAKTYAEAEGLLKSGLSQLANDAEKAAAYNKLVDLAMAKVQHENATIATNQAVKQMGNGKEEPVDSIGLYTSLINALDAAVECEKYDQKPDAKGNIKPKFHEKNAQRVYDQRGTLANAGISYYQNNDAKNAYKYFAKYVDMHTEPLFSQEQAKAEADWKGKGIAEDPDNTAQFAYLAAYYAYQNKDIDACNKYCELAMKDEKWAKEARNLKLTVVQESLKTHEDSVNYARSLEGQLAAAPDDENLFGTLVSMYNGLKMNDAMDALFNKKLQSDPNNFIVWAVRGQNAMLDQKLDEAVEHFKKALNTQPDNAQILTYLGACQLDRASAAANRAAGKTGRVPEAAMSQIRPIYEEALGYLQKAKELDPNKEKANWGYPLYRCCYQLYGDEDPRTKAAEADTH
jgi:tetratricopeptide (TPR) repeat protein